MSSRSASCLPSFAALLSVLLICAFSARAEGPKRIVSVGGDVTEIVYTLGFGDRVVATDTTSLYPEAAQQTRKVGYARNLAAEGILSLDPDLVLLSGTAGPDTTISQLRDAGVPVVVMPLQYSIDGIRGKVRLTAEALGADDAGQALLARIDADWAASKDTIESFTDKPRALFFISLGAGSPRAAGRRTAGHAVMTLIGLENVFSGHEGYKELSLEAAAAADPEVILAMSHNIEMMGGIETIANHPALRVTTAGRQSRIVSVDSSAVMTFGPRTPKALGDLAKSVRAMTGE